VLAAAVLAAIAGAACRGGGEPRPPASAASVVVPVDLPSGAPASYQDDVDVSALPESALVPKGASPTDTWRAIAPDGTQYALAAFAYPSSDPLRTARGLVVWRRFADAPPWRAVYGITDEAEAGVLRIQATVGDATGDGSPDALTFEETGGSGGCGTWRVIDLAANAGVFEKTACDTTVDLSADPVGLAVREEVFRPGDAHCCPSATRTTALIYEGGRWNVSSRTVTPNA